MISKTFSPQNKVGTEMNLDFFMLKPRSNGLGGSRIGLALVHWIYQDTKVQLEISQFISFAGSNFTAVDGPAQGQVAIDTMVQQGVLTRPGYSLQVTGDGCRKTNKFVWRMPAKGTPNKVNVDQFAPTPSPSLAPSYHPSRMPSTAPTVSLDPVMLVGTYNGYNSSEYFGYSLASSNTRLVSGAILFNSTGAAYVFSIQSSGQLVLEKQLVASDLQTGSNFGYAVTVYENVVAVSAPTRGAGSVYVFRRATNGTWAQEEKIIPTNGSNGYYFGWALAMYGDTLAVGGRHQYNSTFADGAVHIYEYDSNGSSNGSHWPQKTIILGNDFSAKTLGSSVALQGNTLLIGSLSNFAIVYMQDGQGTWQFQQKLVPPSGYTGIYFGSSVDVSGGTAVLGDYLLNSNAGAAFVFNINKSTGNWSQVATLTASDSTSNDHFGAAVAIDEKLIFVGAPRKDSYKGAAYQFSFDKSSGQWSQMTKLSPTTNSFPDDIFGQAVVINNGLAAVSRYGYNSNQGSFSVYSH